MNEYKKRQANATSPDDYQKAGDYLQELANKGNVSAMTKLGQCYEYGDTILIQDINIAKKWFKKAAEKEHPIAMYEYGLYLSKVAERDLWHQKAFETGDLYVLGYMYYYGHYVEQNNEKCIKNFLKSNDSSALYMLGNFYQYGFKGVDMDLKEAFKYYLKSANMGYSYAQFNIALYYEKGEGIEKNLTKAYNWYKKAANQNDKRAVDRLKTDKFKNFDRHQNTRNALLCLIAIRKFRKDDSILKILQIDVVITIAKEVWETRDAMEWQ